MNLVTCCDQHFPYTTTTDVVKQLMKLHNNRCHVVWFLNGCWVALCMWHFTFWGRLIWYIDRYHLAKGRWTFLEIWSSPHAVWLIVLTHLVPHSWWFICGLHSHTVVIAMSLSSCQVQYSLFVCEKWWVVCVTDVNVKYL